MGCLRTSIWVFVGEPVSLLHYLSCRYTLVCDRFCFSPRMPMRTPSWKSAFQSPSRTGLTGRQILIFVTMQSDCHLQAGFENRFMVDCFMEACLSLRRCLSILWNT